MRYKIEINGRESKTEGFYEADAMMAYGNTIVAKGHGQARSSVRAARFALEDLSQKLKAMEGDDVPGCEETMSHDGECS